MPEETFDAAKIFSISPEMVRDEKDLSDDQVGRFIVVLEWLEDKLASRIAGLRNIGKERANSAGTNKGDKGSKEFITESTRMLVQNRVGALPNEEKLKLLLADLNVPISAVFKESKAWVLDPSRLNYQIEIGRIPKESVEALKSRSQVLTVKAKKPIE